MSKAISLAVLLGLGATVYFMLSNDNEGTLQVHETSQHNQSDTESLHLTQHSSGTSVELNNQGIPKHLSSGVDMRKTDSPSTQEVSDWNTQKDTIVWQRSTAGEQVLKEEGHIPGDVNNEVYVELDVNELRSVEVGEYLDLYIPQIESSYTGEIDYITEHPNGDRTVEAHIPGAGNLFSAVITIGKNAVYGTLGTQADTYIMEGNGQYAWIASKSDLVAKHSQTHVDAIHPDKHNNTTIGEGLNVSLEVATQP